MSERKGRKRPKSYYIKCAHGGKKAKHANDLDVGMKGFLVTCNKYEKETVREMYNILNEYADKLYGPEKAAQSDNSDHNSSEDDMEKAMMKEAAEMKGTKKECRRFQNTDTKTKNLVFIRTLLTNPCELAYTIFTDIYDSQVQKARFALRMLPVAVTCKANVNQITETAKSLFKPDFETAFGNGLKFTTVCKIRNNNSISRTAILPSLSRIVQEMNPLHTLCHDEPDLVIIVEVIRNICCLSVVKDYFKFKKYNLHEIIRPTEKGPDKVNENEVMPLERKLDAESENIETETTEAETELRKSKPIDDNKCNIQDSEVSEMLQELESVDEVETSRAAENVETEITKTETESEQCKTVTSCTNQDSEGKGMIQDLKSVDEVETDRFIDNSECPKEDSTITVKDNVRVSCSDKHTNKLPVQEIKESQKEIKVFETSEKSSNKETTELVNKK